MPHQKTLRQRATAAAAPAATAEYRATAAAMSTDDHDGVVAVHEEGKLAERANKPIASLPWQPAEQQKRVRMLKRPRCDTATYSQWPEHCAFRT